MKIDFEVNRLFNSRDRILHFVVGPSPVHERNFNRRCDNPIRIGQSDQDKFTRKTSIGCATVLSKCATSTGGPHTIPSPVHERNFSRQCDRPIRPPLEVALWHWVLCPPLWRFSPSLGFGLFVLCFWMYESFRLLVTWTNFVLVYKVFYQYLN